MSEMFTVTDWAVLRAIFDHWQAKHYGPSVRELGTATQHNSTSVITYHLRRLRNLRMIAYDDGVPRSVHLTEHGRQTLGTTTIKDVETQLAAINRIMTSYMNVFGG